MKRFELFFTFLQLPLDYAALVLAGFAAYGLRFSDLAISIRPVIFNLVWEKYWPLVLAVSALWVLIFAFSGLYSTDPNRKFAAEFSKIIMAGSTGFAAITIYVFFTLQKFDSRFLVLVGWILAMAFITAARILIRGLKAALHYGGYGLRLVAIIGAEEIAETIASELDTRRYLGYKVVGIFPHFNQDTAKRLLTTKPDEILFTDPKAHEADTLKAIDFSNEHHLTFKYSADLFSTIASNMTVSALAGVPIIELRRARISGWGRIIKRLIDIVGGLILLIIFLPLYLAITLIILIENGRPIIYKNERVGQNDKNFNAYKFRSLYQKFCTGAQFGQAGEAALEKEKELIKTQSVKPGPVYKIKNDPRVTPFGRFIRRFSLDEIPQFFNVIIGNMSLVGPRPHQPREVEQYEKQQKIVMTVKPGLTGLAQVSGRSNLSFDDEVKLDTFYLENWTILMDLIILLKTPFVVIRRKGAW